MTDDSAPAAPGLTLVRVNEVLTYWSRRRLWTTAVAVIGLAIVISGGLAWISEYRSNDRLADSGTMLTAEVYESSSGRYADLKVQFWIDGVQHRRTIQGGIFSGYRGRVGDKVLIYVNLDEPDLVRPLNHRNISKSARYRLILSPFALALVALSHGSFVVVRSLREAVWYSGDFQVDAWGRRFGMYTSFAAELWDAEGASLLWSRKMQGRFRSGRPRTRAYFAVLDKHVLALPDGDNGGVLVRKKRKLELRNQQPVSPA